MPTLARQSSGIALVFGVSIAALAVGGRTSSVPHSTATAPITRVDPVTDSSLWMQMHNVDLHIDADHVIRVRSLNGQVLPTAAGTVAWLDRPASFAIRATSGTIALD